MFNVMSEADGEGDIQGDTDIEKKHMDTKGESGEWDNLGDWD